MIVYEQISLDQDVVELGYSRKNCQSRKCKLAIKHNHHVLVFNPSIYVYKTECVCGEPQNDRKSS